MLCVGTHWFFVPMLRVGTFAGYALRTVTQSVTTFHSMQSMERVGQTAVYPPPPSTFCTCPNMTSVSSSSPICWTRLAVRRPYTVATVSAVAGTSKLARTVRRDCTCSVRLDGHFCLLTVAGTVVFGSSVAMRSPCVACSTSSGAWYSGRSQRTRPFASSAARFGIEVNQPL